MRRLAAILIYVDAFAAITAAILGLSWQPWVFFAAMIVNTLYLRYEREATNEGDQN